MARKTFIDEVKLGIFVLLVLAMLAYLSVKIGGVGVGESIKAYTFVEDASGLVKDAAVSIAGVRVGTVRDLTVVGRRARITFTITPEAKVRTDAIATIRAKSLLGEKYLDIIPQSDSAPLLKTGDTLNNVIETTDVDQLITRMKPLLDSFVGTPQKPGMLDDAAALAKMLRQSVAEARDTLPDLLRNLRDLTTELRILTNQNKEKLSKTLESVDKLASTSAGLLEQNARKLNEILDSAHHLARTTAQLAAQNEKPLARIIQNTDHLTAALAEHSNEILKNLTTLSANLATASARFPELTERLNVLSAKMDTMLDITNKLLTHPEDTHLFYLMRKILQEEGLHLNMFPRKVKPPSILSKPTSDKPAASP